MFEIQKPNSSNSSFLKDSLTNMQQDNRFGQPSVSLRPVGLGQINSGNAGRNVMPINQQTSGNTTTTPNPAPATKPLDPANPPSYLPPIQTRNDQGKTLPKYRMGVGHRILGTLANFANGFAGNRAQPIYVGPGALNNRYYQEEAQRQQQNQENLDWWRTQHPDDRNPKTYGDPNSSGSNQSNTSPGSKPASGTNLFAPQSSAREMFALARSRALPAPDYRFTAFNPTTNQRIGSHDGKTWSDLPNSDSTQT